jgi:hypothetical protein
VGVREARTIKKERVRALVEADPVFRRDDQYFNDRVTTYTRGLQKIHRIQQRRRELRLDDDEQRLFKQYVGDTLPVCCRHVFDPTLALSAQKRGRDASGACDR